MRERHPRNTYAKFKNCIFCENEANTAEHIIPKWIGRKLAIKDNAYTEYNHFDGKQYGERVRIKASSPITGFTTKCVCSMCNSGWMSRLVDESKPLISSLIDGTHFCTLEQRDQNLLLKQFSVFSCVVDVSNSTVGPIFNDQIRRDFQSTGTLGTMQLFLGISRFYQPNPPFNVGIERSGLSPVSWTRS